MKMRTGVVGLGKMGLVHTSILSTFPNIQIVALCDKSRLINKFVNKNFNEIKIVNSVELLRDFDLDIIYITTPIPSHFKIVEMVYSYDIAHNVFVEKTLAGTSTEAEKLCQIAKQHHGANMVGYQKRYCVTFQKARELMNQDVLGTLIRFKVYSYSSDFIDLKKEEMGKVSASRGGVLRDLGAHAISLALWYFGDLIPTLNRTEQRGGEDPNGSVRFDVENVNGIKGHIETSWCKEGYRMPETGLVIEGSKGILFVNDDKVKVESREGNVTTWYRQDLNDNVGFLLWTPEYYRENYHFIKCVTNDELPNPDFLEASKVDRIIERVT